jgi:cobyrinic acid a,c-diamide synthase
MAGVFDSEVVMHDRPQGLSYTLLGCIKGNAIADAGDRLRGHEFHYSSVDNLRETEFAFEVLRGKGIGMGREGITAWNALAMYTHMHYLAAPKVVDKLKRACEGYSRQ